MLSFEQAPEILRQQLVCLDEVHAPHDAVVTVGRRERGGEVERDERRVGPVDQSRRQAVMLRQCQPMPDRVDTVCRSGMGVLPEVPQQGLLEWRGVYPGSCQAFQTGGQVVSTAVETAECVGGSEAPQVAAPGAFV